MSIFYEKLAEANYYSKHLPQRDLDAAFLAASKRRADRDPDGSSYGRRYALTGAAGGALVGGLGARPEHRLASALGGGAVGGLVGYLGGSGADITHKRNTLEARELLKMSPKARQRALMLRRAAHFDQQEQEERAMRERNMRANEYSAYYKD
jgi:hypothetical protein